MSLAVLLKRLATAAGRRIEHALTGQTEYRVISSAEPDFQRVDNNVKGKLVLAEVCQLLARAYRIEVHAPVLLEVFSPGDASAPALRWLLHGAVGSYQPHRLGERSAHQIFVVNELSRARFKAVVAHELVHAYERESSILQSNRALREGFARWIEYRTLLSEGEQHEAQKLLRIRRHGAGRSLRELLDIEKDRGVQGVLAFVHTVS